VVLVTGPEGSNRRFRPSLAREAIMNQMTAPTAKEAIREGR